jgi:hypothetical protein
MGRSTFSGPLRAGTQRDDPAANVGNAILSQVFDSGDQTGKVIGNTDTLLGYLPAGAQIVDIIHDQVVAAGTGTMTLSVGTTSGGAELAAAVATTAGGRFRGVATATTQLAWQTSAAADTPIYVRSAVGTGTLTAGRVVTTVLYRQN